MSTHILTRPDERGLERATLGDNLHTLPAPAQDQILLDYSDEIADHMANDFARHSPALSARAGFALWQKVAGILLVALAALTMAFVPAVFCLALVVIGAVVTLGQYLISAAGLRTPDARRRARRTSPAIPDDELPSYTVLVPAYHEEQVIGGLVNCLGKLDYPAHLLEVLILVERRDMATKEAIRAAQPASFVRVVEIPPGTPQTKPRSCNAGLMLAKGELLVIYDAEDRPEPGQLRVAAARFKAGGERLACVQAKLMVHNGGASFVARQFALEYCLRYELTLPGLARLGLPVPLGGTSNHFRTDVLRRLGGWDAWNVTEDADLGMRTRALGYEVDVIDSVTWGEAPTQLRPWVRQRTRWFKGFMLTHLVHTRRPLHTWRSFRPSGMLTLLLLLAGTPMLFLTQSLLVAVSATGYQGPFHLELPIQFPELILQIAMLTVYAGLAVTAARRRGLASSVFAPLVPVYWLMYWWAAWRALYQLVRSPFVWEKTPHGEVAAVPAGGPATP
jgi:cellulose synthase/poly-beta-1,6-N-acetylglucosamine synthase-like glycosyltransferase